MIWERINYETASDDCDGENVLLGWELAMHPTAIGHFDDDLKKFCCDVYGNDFSPQPDFWTAIQPVPR